MDRRRHRGTVLMRATCGFCRQPRRDDCDVERTVTVVDDTGPHPVVLRCPYIVHRETLDKLAEGRKS